MPTKTYTGSCHCGDVRFEVDLDLAEGTTRCNCTMCTKVRNWSVHVRPAAFRLRTDRAALADYQRGGAAHWWFCKRCGVRPFSEGFIAELGGDIVAVQLGCLDDAPADELLAGPVYYADGRADTWAPLSGETRHL